MTALETWLQAATQCLSADSADQVRKEIREHYESARDAAIDGGATPEDADRSAVSSLGNPGTANRQYRRVLLTETEANMLRTSQWERKGVCARPWLLWLLRATPVVALCAAALAFVSGHTLLARLLLPLGVGTAVFFAAPTFPLYTPPRARVFRWVKWVAIIMSTAAAFGSSASNWAGALAISFSGIVWIEWTRRSIRRKLPVAEWPKELFL